MKKKTKKKLKHSKEEKVFRMLKTFEATCHKMGHQVEWGNVVKLAENQINTICMNELMQNLEKQTSEELQLTIDIASDFIKIEELFSSKENEEKLKPIKQDEVH